MRNILAKVPPKDKRRFAVRLKQIWLHRTKNSAKRAAAQLVQEYCERFPEATCCLEEGLEDSLQIYGFSEIDPKKISSTNMSSARSGKSGAGAGWSGSFHPSALGFDWKHVISWNTRRLVHRSGLYQTGEGPGSHRTRPGFPGSSGSKLKRV
jgi:hypothetical protein